MANGRSFWSSNRVFISKACLLLPLWLINITSFSVCLSEITDYCSTTVEWRRGLMTLKKKRQKTKSTIDFVEKKKLINLSFSACLNSYKQLCLKNWSLESWTILPPTQPRAQAHEDFGLCLYFFSSLYFCLEYLKPYKYSPRLAHKSNT